MAPIFMLWILLAILFVFQLKPTISKVIVYILKVYSSNFELETESSERFKLEAQSSEGTGYTWLSLKIDNNHRIHFPRMVKGMLVFLLYCVCASTVAIFWDKAVLASKIDECIIGDGFDCFRRDSRLTYLPLNCSTFNKSVSIVCYRIAMDFPRGIAEAGGVPVTSASILVATAKVLFYSKVYFKKILCCKCRNKTKEKIITLVMATAQIFLLAISMFAIIGGLTITPAWNYLRSNAAKLLTTMSTVLTIYAIIWIPWYLCYFETIKKENNTKKET